MRELDVTSLYNRRADNRWERCSIGDVFERVAVSRPDAPALVARPGAFAYPQFERLSYRQADQWSNRFANALHHRGLTRGDRVLMLCENSAEAFVAKIGIAKAGCVAVPVNPSQVADFMAHALSLTEPKLIVADAECRRLATESDCGVDVTIPIGDGKVEGVGYREFCLQGGAGEPDATIHGDDIWQILFTSGTTAMPKGVMISHTYSTLMALSWIPAQTRGLVHESLVRTACFSPVIYHVGDQGWVLPTLLAGGTVILGRGLKPERVAEAVAAEGATLAIAGGRPLAQRFLTAIENLGAEAVKSLTVVIQALAMLSPEELARFETIRPGVTVTYIAGQTESAVSHRLTYDAFPADVDDARARNLNLIGRPGPTLASTVVDLTDGTTVVPHGTEGELVYRSPVMTAGYYRDPQATERAFAGGWFHTGDVGTTEPGGGRSITGRLKDMIKTGGENVASMRVESVVVQHPDIAEVAVIGLPDQRWGESVTAVVVPEAGTELDPDALIAFCRTKLSGFETPKRVFVVDALPTGFGGKILKSELRQRFSQETED